MKKLYLFLLLAIGLIQPLSSMHVDPLDALYNICYVGFDDRKFLEIIHAYQATHEEALTTFANSKRPTPLLWAAINGNELMFKELLHYADFTNPWNRATLYWAVRLHRTKIVHLLLSAKIDPDATSLYNNNLDIMTKAQTIKKYIVQTKYWHQTSITPLAQAVKNNNVDLVCLLIKKDAQEPVDNVITANTNVRIVNVLYNHQLITKETVKTYQSMPAVLRLFDKNKTISKNGQISGEELALIASTMLFGVGIAMHNFIQGAGQDHCPAIALLFS